MSPHRRVKRGLDRDSIVRWIGVGETEGVEGVECRTLEVPKSGSDSDGRFLGATRIDDVRLSMQIHGPTNHPLRQQGGTRPCPPPFG